MDCKASTIRPARAGQAGSLDHMASTGTLQGIVALQSTNSAPPTLAAFYLPQFHPTPENDEFWGEGFTEWRNVAQARPLFDGHEQPRVPANLGFYDLRCVETQIAQAELASAHGVGAFCYYHYWFNGRRVLHRPLEQMLEHRSISMPFFLCWANENWTRRWDGRDGEVLLTQRYSEQDDREHIRALLPVFADARYFRVDGRPVLLVYRSRLLPDPKRTTDIWREESDRAGVGNLHLCAVESLSAERGDPSELGFDAAVEFAPDWTNLGEPLGRSPLRQLLRRIGRSSPWFDHRIYSYQDLADRMEHRPEPPHLRYGGVTPRWDNSPRRRHDSVVFQGSTPARYERWLSTMHQRAVSLGHPLVFVNAWNEWAEGAHLEPDLEHGLGYLEATARVMKSPNVAVVPEGTP